MDPERDDYDDLPPDRRRRSNPAVGILLVLAGVAVILLGVCGGGGALFWMRAEPAAPAGPAVAPVGRAGAADSGATRRVYDRDEFKGLVLGENPAKVRELAGPPDRVEEQERPVWHYTGRTRDPVSGRVDGDTTVVFGNGVVVEVRFVPANPTKMMGQ